MNENEFPTFKASALNAILLRPQEYGITFYHPEDNTRVVARLKFGETGLIFEGDIEQSAQRFFEAIKPLVDQYIESRKRVASQ